MSTTEETTPLFLAGPFYLPVVLPPDLVLTNPLKYYEKLETDGVKVTATPGSGPTDPLAIEVEGTNIEQDRKKNAPSVQVGSVPALTAGFVKYEQGDVVLRLWPGDFQNLVKSPIGQRPNRIVYGSLDATSVETRFKTYIGELSKDVLQESWKQKNSGVPPDDETVLRDALLNRFKTGDAAIYVDAGSILGTGTSSGTNKMQLTVQCFFDPADPLLPTIAIPTEDLIDNAKTPGRVRLYAGHPLVKAVSEIEVTVNFQSQFLIFNNATQAYEPFALKPVLLLAAPEIPIVPDDLIPSIPVALPQITDPLGRINLTVTLPSSARIRFRYATSGLTVGNRLFDQDIETHPHKARSHVDPNAVNAYSYRAKYEIYPAYQAFIDEIVARGSFEQIEKDRGTADGKDRSTLDLNDAKNAITGGIVELVELALPDKLEPRVALSQHELHTQIIAFEAFHRLDVIPLKSNTFNLLCEGDSWTNYPVAYNDLYSHLDDIFQRKLLPGKSYNRVPLQHYGDLGRQMFATATDGKRQFDFTLEFLREYKIDLILCSAGGNDFAEPGISADFDLKPYKNHIDDDGYFDPYAAQGALSAAEMAIATSLMGRSFAALLRNHPWNFFVQGLANQQKSETQLRTALDPLIGDVDFGPTPEEIADIENQISQLGSLIDPQSIANPIIRSLFENAVDQSQEALLAEARRRFIQEIGTKVIAKFPDEPPPASPAEQILQTVFDTGTTSAFFDKRYAMIKQHWEVLLGAATALGIPVISHIYGYPLFSESPTSLLGTGRHGLTGPWFTHRFKQARVVDRRVQKMCLKAFLDHFERNVFRPLKTQSQPQYLFDYVNSRNFNSDVDLWRDELHLRSRGYRKIADAVFTKARQWGGVASFFEA